MRKILISTLSFLLLSIFQSALVSVLVSHSVTVPSQLPKEINALAGYQWSLTEECQNEFRKAVGEARRFCAEYKTKHPEQELAIVSDIDETILDNRSCLKELDHEDWTKFFLYIGEGRAPILRETAEFLAWARQNGFCIFFVTGRHEKYRAATIRNLNKDGVSYDGLYLRADEDDRRAEVYKSEVRQKIEQMGFTIVENIGDQFSDLEGGHSLDCQKLPNRMYFIK